MQKTLPVPVTRTNDPERNVKTSDPGRKVKVRLPFGQKALLTGKWWKMAPVSESTGLSLSKLLLSACVTINRQNDVSNCEVM